MQKINVIGTSGSGKTTFARSLAAALSYPCIEMDAVFWRENWQETPDDLFFPRLRGALDQETWVLDGNYTRTIPVKWESVDTVIWIDFSFGRTLFQAIWRAISRIISQQELWPGTGNRESVRLLFSRDSIVLWTLKTFWRNRKRYVEMMNSDEYAHIQFIRLRSPGACREFLKSLSGSQAH